MCKSYYLLAICFAKSIHFFMIIIDLFQVFFIDLIQVSRSPDNDNQKTVSGDTPADTPGDNPANITGNSSSFKRLYKLYRLLSMRWCK